MITLQELYSIFIHHPHVVIDSRKAIDNCIFFALRGERSDGNQFAEKAIQNGAAYAVIDNPDFKKSERYLLVQDVLKTLQDLAQYHRQHFEIPIIAITGSNGKTTTKELTHAVLNKRYKTHCTQGNLNNHIGLPLTLLAMKSDTEIAVVEMGANHIGEIGFLCKIARPTHGLITNVGKAHLEGFGSFEGVKKAKSELYKFLAKNGGTAFVNLDEPFLKALSEGISHRVFYRQNDQPSVGKDLFETKLVTDNPFVKIAFPGGEKLIEVQSQIIGSYNFNNIQTAITVGQFFAVPSSKIKEAIESYIPSSNRSQVIDIAGNTFILDAYNANPNSMRQALDNFLKMQGVHKIVILGDMLELGSFSSQEHRDIIELAKKMNFDKLILVGKEFENAARENNDLLCFETTGVLKDWFVKQQFKNALILLKGSRGIQLEKLLE
jgi:UDP-N-acetylmuramoyl-tripeptide--D-alanyl-D-alanine ligase